MFLGKFKYLFLALLIPLVSVCSWYGVKELSSTKSIVLTSAEGKQYYTGLVKPPGYKATNIKSALEELNKKGMALPDAYDLKTKYKLASAEDQGSCGSCWAFAITGVFKDVLRINGISKVLSQQFLLDCNDDGYSCNGGFFDAHDLHRDKGNVILSDYPYLGQQTTCKSGLKYNEKIISWHYIPGGDNPSTDELKAAIYQYGTIAVGVAADSAMSNYTGGLFNGSGATELNHAVNLVGWTADSYWIMKNSWGQNWGENGGYMRIKFGANLIGAQANYVVFSNSPDPTPTPTPTPPPTPPDPTPIPPCYPQPYASTGYPSQVQIWRGKSIYLGTRAVQGTTYLWKAVPDFNGGAVPREAMIKFTPSITKTLTMYATNKCGTAQATTTVIVNGLTGNEIPDLEKELENIK